MSTNIQENKYKVYTPLNFDKVNAVDEVTKRRIVVNKEEDVSKRIANNEHIDIPYFYNQMSNVITLNTEPLKKTEQNPNAKPKDYVKDLRLDFILPSYLKSLLRHVENKTLTVQQLRKYLYVRSAVVYHLNQQHAQRIIGKALSVVPEFETAEKIREMTNDNKYQEREFFYVGEQTIQDQDKIQNILQKGISKILFNNYYEDSNEAIINDTRDKFITTGRDHYLYYNLESIRITNLVVDEVIANNRNLKEQYDIKFNYLKFTKGVDANGNEEIITDDNVYTYEEKVFSITPSVFLANLKKEANISDDVFEDAKKVASILVETHKQYIKENKGVNNKTDKANFYQRHINLYEEPQEGDFVYLPIEKFQLAYIYLDFELIEYAKSKQI